MSRGDDAARVMALLKAIGLARDPHLEPRNALPMLQALQRWQGQRLATSFADLRADPRYAAATAFFVEELYGPSDMAWRDRDLARMLPKLRAWLPSAMLQTVAGALELDLISHEFDLAVAQALDDARIPASGIDAVNYAAAYRTVGDRAGRERQLALLLRVGADLDRIVKKPMIYAILRLARAPARAAGLHRLQEFLEHGFAAFGSMGGAEEFLARIGKREGEVLKRMFGGHPKPFG